jgi:hypothetical protein
MIYIGIDNGVSGGLVALGPLPGPPIASLVMPIYKRNGEKEIDVCTIRDWLNGIAPPDCFSVFLEKPVGSKSAEAARSMSGSFHALRALLELRGIHWRAVIAKEWQSVMLPKTKKDDTKLEAIKLARQYWPMEKWFATSRCWTPHDGLVDAALIAEYGRRINNKY